MCHVPELLPPPMWLETCQGDSGGGIGGGDRRIGAFEKKKKHLVVIGCEWRCEHR